MIAFWDIFVFFGVLMVGFAYVWRRGDINWVRSYAHHVEPPLEDEKILEQKVRICAPPGPARRSRRIIDDLIRKPQDERSRALARSGVRR